MRKVRAMICICFLVSLVVCAAYTVKVKLVEDHQAPVITCDKDEITVSVKDGEEALLEGIKAEDNRDGDLTADVRVASMSHMVNGKRTVEYVVFDSSNQVGILERTISYSDYEPPRIYMEKPLRFSVNHGNKITFDEHFAAEDSLDGNLTNQVRTIMEENYYSLQEGIYNVVLQVSNSAGDVCSVPVEMQIFSSADEGEREKEYPLLSEYIVYTSEGKKIDTEEYLIGISRNETEYEFDEVAVSKADIKIKGDVDYEKPGVYQVEYSYKAAGAANAVTKLYVVVEAK